jgi:hypothetical protein
MWQVPLQRRHLLEVSKNFDSAYLIQRGSCHHTRKQHVNSPKVHNHLLAFPQAASEKFDASARVIKKALDLPYPPTKSTNETELNHCSNNLLAAWPLIQTLAENGKGDFLQKVFRLCKPIEADDVPDFLAWAQSIWFDLAEGSFPYPSSYIPFALLHKKVNLPAWPLQAACYETSELHKDWGVRFSGNVSDVRYNITYGSGKFTLHIDWDQITKADSININEPILTSDDQIVGLLENVRDALSIWYNVTKDVQCYDYNNAAPNTKLKKERVMYQGLHSIVSKEERLLRDDSASPAEKCQAEMDRTGSWEPLCCNDEVNLVITEATGLGGDFYWPPSNARNIKSYDDLVKNATFEPCDDPDGSFGYSKETIDPFSTWMDSFYGGTFMKGHSNILFSNGLLDPW